MNAISFVADKNVNTFWDTVGVTINGQPYDAARQIILDLTIGDGSGEDAGIQNGGTLNAVIKIDDGNGGLQDAPIFPGYIDIKIGSEVIRVENYDPHFNFMQTRVYMEEIEISEDITEIHTNIDAISGNVEAYFSYVDSSMLGVNNIATVTMI